MAVNMDKPHRWKADVLQSVDFYNHWFVQFAPETYREQRIEQTGVVKKALEQTDYLRDVTPKLLRDHPEILPMLRMATSPPLARDRLIGLAYVTPNLVKSMEETSKHAPRIPPRMAKAQADEELERICQIIERLADRDLFVWLNDPDAFNEESIQRGALILADRLCGAAADPIIRNAQEQRQLQALRDWLEARGYRFAASSSIEGVDTMMPGTFSFLYNVPVHSGSKSVNIAVDCIVKPRSSQREDLPLFVEAKSAGDFTNTNKRRKEEAQKARQLRETYGTGVQFSLFLCGYFDTPYLGYEAAEGIDWVWEHRIDDLALLLGDEPPSGDGTAVPIQPPTSPKTEEPEVAYVTEAEQRRQAFQRLLDAEKTQSERNILGQFATPPRLARDILAAAQALLVDRKTPIDFLDPAFGTGSFFSALLDTFAPDRLGRCHGIEIDPHYGKPAAQLWADSPLKLHEADFTALPAPASEGERFDLLICNPPYVRHHHLASEEKKRLVAIAQQRASVRPSGLTGLYAHFMYLAHPWMREGGIAGWLIPSEWLSVNYGRTLRQYLLDRMTLLHIHQFNPEDTQFDDALVSSTVVWFQACLPKPAHTVRFSYGGSLAEPSQERVVTVAELRRRPKWSGLFAPRTSTSESSVLVRDLFRPKRGLATGANQFFLLAEDEIERRGLPWTFFRPALPSPRYLPDPIIRRDAAGWPLVGRRRFLLHCRLPEREVERDYPALWAYLQEGVAEGISERYLCRKRSPWYSQEERAPARFLCSYMGRGSAKGTPPLRFFHNRSEAVATNVYLNLYPKGALEQAMQSDPELEEMLWEALNQVGEELLQRHGRTYGGGLLKIEPKELGATPLPGLTGDIVQHVHAQTALFA